MKSMRTGTFIVEEKCSHVLWTTIQTLNMDRKTVAYKWLNNKKRLYVASMSCLWKKLRLAQEQVLISSTQKQKRKTENSGWKPFKYKTWNVFQVSYLKGLHFLFFFHMKPLRQHLDNCELFFSTNTHTNKNVQDDTTMLWLQRTKRISTFKTCCIWIHGIMPCIWMQYILKELIHTNLPVPVSKLSGFVQFIWIYWALEGTHPNQN